MKEDKISANISGELHGDKRAHILYEDQEGKKLVISFQWQTKQKGSGGYFSMDEYYVETHVSEPGLLTSKEIYRNKKKVGEDIWVSRAAGGGSKEQGIQTFEQFLQDKEVFKDVEPELRTILCKAQCAAAVALHGYYKKNYNRSKLASLCRKLAHNIRH